MSGEKENSRRTFLTFRQRIEFLRRTFCSISSRWTFCPTRIYPFAGHLKISPDMFGETGGFHVLCYVHYKSKVDRSTKKLRIDQRWAHNAQVDQDSDLSPQSSFSHSPSHNGFCHCRAEYAESNGHVRRNVQISGKLSKMSGKEIAYRLTF